MEKLDISTAKNKLYDSLKECDEVAGIGIKNENNIQHIVVYLTEATRKILSQIPSYYKGNRVKTLITGSINSY